MSVLAPQDRTALLEALRPPIGYVLHTAVGTTFSLDLVAMLSASVGFTFFELDGSGTLFDDQTSLELLEAIRRHANQILVFCESGRIAVPPKHRPLFSYLEDRIVQAKAPVADRAFHPKLWVIRYASDTGDVKYRLLCMTRNLTFDKCLDTIIVLDGDYRADRTVGYRTNAPLREFLEALPGMAVSGLTKQQTDQCALIAAEISRVQWDWEGLPIDEVVFWPLGHEAKKTWPFRDAGNRMLVVSPFLNGSLLTRLCEHTADNILISRRHVLDRLTPEERKTFTDIYVLRDHPEPEDGGDSTATPSEHVDANDLHAKLFVADRGWDASVWTGSANATHAAFDGNVEFLVELRGKKSKLGIDAFFAEPPGGVGIRSLLSSYQPDSVGEPDVDLEVLEKAVDDMRREVATLQWKVTVTAEDKADCYTVRVQGSEALRSVGTGVSVSVRPLALKADAAQSLADGAVPDVVFASVGIESLTSFLVVEIIGRAGDRETTVRFVMNATLVGEPPNRRERLLQSMLKNKRDVIRYLRLLLADVDDDGAWAGVGDGYSAGHSAAGATESEALLEPLLRTFERHPDRLVAVAKLVHDLEGSPDSAALVPEGLSHLVNVLLASRAEESP